MAVNQTGFSLPHIGRKWYFVCAGLLVAIMALMPLSFGFVGGPAGWLLLFMARIRDIRNNVWTWPALVLVGTEMFGREIVPLLESHVGRSGLGYAVIALVVVHLGFIVALGVQPSRSASVIS